MKPWQRALLRWLGWIDCPWCGALTLPMWAENHQAMVLPCCGAVEIQGPVQLRKGGHGEPGA